VSKPILFHAIDGVLFGEYDRAVQLRPGVSAWLERAFQHFDVIWLTSWAPEKVKALLADTSNAHLLQLFQYADWMTYADKATWLADARTRYRERDVYWIDNAAVPVAGVQIIRVNPQGPDELVEARDRLLFSLLVKNRLENLSGADADPFGRTPPVYRWPSS